MKSISLLSAIICCLIIATVGLGYYPKWSKPGTEATISWDVSGYYMYLPAILIHKDIKHCAFHEKVLTEYNPTYDFQQAFKHSSGNYVMKYPAGMAIMYLPAFVVAHGYSLVSDRYAADGFSIPYQLAISIWNFLIAFLGIFYLRRILLFYFSEAVVATTLILVTIGTNYLNYSAIDGAMTHNYLFTLYCLLIYHSILWHRGFHWRQTVVIGALVGIMSLIRPTEIIACMIPLLWNAELWSLGGLISRFRLLIAHYKKLLVAASLTAAIGFIQLAYWKYVAEEWLVYSYEDQGFSWLHPHVHDGLLSYKSGWLVYSPMMMLGIIGLYFLIRHYKFLISGTIPFLILFTYIITAWDIWWYGGSLGNRAMIQSYPLWAFAISALITSISTSRLIIKCLVSLAVAVFLYFNLWFIHQAHHGGLLHAGMMTKAYFWKILGTYERHPLDTKLLDTDEAYDGEVVNATVIYQDSFDDIQTNCNDTLAQGFLCLNGANQYSDPISVALPNLSGKHWIRIHADYTTPMMEWDVWKMCQSQVTVFQSETLLKTKMIRIQRHLSPGQTNTIWIDIDIRDLLPDRLVIQWWNAGGDKLITIDNLLIEAF